MKVLPGLLVFLFQAQISLAGATARSERLFVIERNTNANYVCYDANIEASGALNSENPVSAYWIMAATDGHREDLNFFERTRAYGFTAKREPASATVVLTLDALENQLVRLRVSGGVARAETEIAGHPALLKKVFVQSSPGFFFPSVQWIKLIGQDLTSGAPLEATVVPE